MEELTDRVNKYLNRMDSMLDWRFGVAFRYYSNRVANCLTDLDPMKCPSYGAIRLRYSVLIHRAKLARLID